MSDQHRDLADKMLALAKRTPGYIAFFDGCCEPRNPGGTAGFGAVIFKSTGGGIMEHIWDFSGMIPPAPSTSNNIAEYLAVDSIFDWCLKNDPKARIRIFGDSRLVVCQLWGWPKPGKKLWKINGVDNDKPKGFYADCAAAVRTKLKALPGAQGFWIPRENNEIADDLSKAELRRLGVEFRIQPEEQPEGVAT